MAVALACDHLMVHLVLLLRFASLLFAAARGAPLGLSKPRQGGVLGHLGRPRLSGTVKHRSQQELFSGSLQNLRSQQKPSQRAVSGPLRAGFIDWPLAPSVPDMIHGAADAERDLIQDAVLAKVRQSCWPCVQCCLLLHISAGQLMLNHLQRVWDTFASKACSHP